MKKLFQDWFKGPGNTNYEAGRFLWFVSVIAGIVYAGFHLFVNKTFNIIEFGTGMGSLLALGGGGIAMKDYAAKPAVPKAVASVKGDLNIDAGDK